MVNFYCLVMELETAISGIRRKVPVWTQKKKVASFRPLLLKFAFVPFDDSSRIVSVVELALDYFPIYGHMVAYVKGFAQFSSSTGRNFINGNLQLLKMEFFEHPTVGSSLIFQAEVILIETNEPVKQSIMKLGNYLIECKDGDGPLQKYMLRSVQSHCSSMDSRVVYEIASQHDDARMCLDIAFTACRHGAAIANYVEVIELLKGPSDDPKQKDANGNPKLVVNGARMKDLLTGKEFTVHARCVVNAAGPFTDDIRKMENKEIKSICQPSSGIHIASNLITLNKRPDIEFIPENMGLLDPSTTDGRVIFFLPWLGHVVAGTTDHPCEVTTSPEPTDDDVQFILSEIKSYLSTDLKVRRGDVLSVWSGIRPLVSDPNSKDTQSIARNHIISVGDNNLITIAGGKWTTYRKMAEETVDKCVKVCGLKPKSKCQTLGLRLNGAHGWSPNLFIQLTQEYGIERDVAVHLASTYGGRAVDIAQLAKLTGRRYPLVGRKLHPDFPIIEAEDLPSLLVVSKERFGLEYIAFNTEKGKRIVKFEDLGPEINNFCTTVKWACKEYASNAIDFLARRSRVAFLNVQVAEEILPKVIDLMGDEYNWSCQRKRKEFYDTMRFLRTEMGLGMKRNKEVLVNFTEDEKKKIISQFESIDVEKKGFITLNDLRNFYKACS
ncbi:hypothetical protein ACTXT7_001321 [Hymenolepis weldensis]